jgi:hypothetical protein
MTLDMAGGEGREKRQFAKKKKNGEKLDTWRKRAKLVL